MCETLELQAKIGLSVVVALLVILTFGIVAFIVYRGGCK